MPLMYIIILKSFYSKEDSLNNVNRLVTKKVILFYYSTWVNFCQPFLLCREINADKSLFWGKKLIVYF